MIKSLSYTSHDLVHFPSTATTLVHIITVISSLGSHSDHLTAPPPLCLSLQKLFIDSVNEEYMHTV